MFKYKDDNERKESLRGMIQARIDDNELIPCQFSVSKTVDDKYVKEVTDIFDKYEIEYNSVDTLSGAFNLNRDWIQTDYKKSPVPCAVEYCGAYPANWDIEDVLKLVKLEEEGKIIIMVYYISDDDLVPNH